MFWYSWQLTLIALGMLAADRRPQPRGHAALPRAAQPAVPARRAQPGLPHRVRLRHGHGEVAADGAACWKSATATSSPQYLAAGFDTRQLANTYNVVANALEQAMTLAILCVGALLVMQQRRLHHRHAGRLPDVRQPHVASRCCAWSACGRSSSRPTSPSSAWATSWTCPPSPYALDPAARRPGATAGRASSSRTCRFRYSDQHPWLYRNLNLDAQARPAHRAHGPVGLRQEHARQAAARLLPAQRRPDPDRRPATSATWRANELRAHFGVVPQETVLFSGTIYDNLHAGQPARQLRRDRRGLPHGRDPRRHRSACRRATRPRSASTASASPAARRSASPSPARCSSARRC